jgi:hypothetical protein
MCGGKLNQRLSDMDNRLKTIVNLAQTEDGKACIKFGYEFAIQRLRENKYYGHYAQNLADWLEKHLTEQVPNPTLISLKGEKNGK